nr:GAF domain-containing sensor histidine kinase [Allomuricauda sp.]
MYTEENDRELKRLKKLSEFDLNYGQLQEQFKGLVQLAAHVADTDISLVNLIGNHSQWTVSAYGAKLFEMPRQDSICQYTIQGDDPMEIPRLDMDERFMDKPYTQGDEGFRYYLGIPLEVGEGVNIGALCVIDKEEKQISGERKRLLGLIADEIVNKLEQTIKLDHLQESLNRAQVQRNQLAHDIRGPVGGILGLAKSTETAIPEADEFTMYMEMIKAAAAKVLNLTDDILERYKDRSDGNNFTLTEFKKHLEELYALPALNKQINLQVFGNESKAHYMFSRRKLLPITGNLIGNAIKFTPSNGKVLVELDISTRNDQQFLEIMVKDTGKGIPKEKLQQLGRSQLPENHGTRGEKGYGLGLQLVADLVNSLQGTLNLEAVEGQGTTVTVTIPIEVK